MSLQYFVNYNFTQAVYFTSSPIVTANWKAPEGERWTVPFGAGVGMIFKIGKQPMNGQLSAYYNAIKPDTVPAADWTLGSRLRLPVPRRRADAGRASRPSSQRARVSVFEFVFEGGEREACRVVAKRGSAPRRADAAGRHD